MENNLFFSFFSFSFLCQQISYNAPGRWVSERLSSTTASENEQTSPNLSYVIPSRLPLGMPRSYGSYDANGQPVDHHTNVEINYQRAENLPSPPSDYRYSREGNHCSVDGLVTNWLDEMSTHLTNSCFIIQLLIELFICLFNG